MWIGESHGVQDFKRSIDPGATLSMYLILSLTSLVSTVFFSFTNEFYKWDLLPTTKACPVCMIHKFEGRQRAFAIFFSSIIGCDPAADSLTWRIMKLGIFSMDMSTCSQTTLLIGEKLKQEWQCHCKQHVSCTAETS